MTKADWPWLDAVTSTTPFATARTRPVASTVAIMGSSVAQVTAGFGIRKRRLSLATATIRLVSAIAVSVSRLGVTIRNRTTCRTTSVAVSAAVPTRAMIFAVPAPVTVTSPAVSTRATAGSLLDQCALARGRMLLVESNAMALNCTVRPTVWSVSTRGATSTPAATWVTATEATPLTLSAAAAIATVPSSRAVTSPVASTCASSESELDQVNATLGTATPRASNAVAFSRVVSPNRVKLRVGESTATRTTTTWTANTVSGAPIAVW